MPSIRYCKLIVSICMAADTLLLSSIVFAEVPDTNSYWKILVEVQKQAGSI